MFIYCIYIYKSSFKSYTYFYKTYLFSRGNDFRKDFQDLSCLKAYFTDIQMLAVTATAPPSTIHLIQKSLCMDTCKIVTVNPNRNNIYLEVKMRDSNSYGNKGYEKILCPIADSFIQRTNYPMTIIYLKFKYCGFAYSLFDRIFQESQYVGERVPFIPLILSISCTTDR